MRPTTFENFHGQKAVVDNLRIAVLAALKRGTQLGHVLLSGPAGVGKTTLGASVIPEELGVGACSYNCTAIDTPQAMVTVLTQVPPRGILFLDEIHAMAPAAREHLLTALEDRYVSTTIGDRENESVIRVDLPSFTIIGATTRPGRLDGPTRTRFTHSYTLDLYTSAELAQILHWHAEQQDLKLGPDAAVMLAQASRGIARNAVNLLLTSSDTALVEHGDAVIGYDTAQATLARLGFQHLVIPSSPKEEVYATDMDMRYMRYLHRHGVAGLKTLEAVLNEDETTLETVIEPWLLQHELIVRTNSGRRLSCYGLHLMDKSGKA